MTTRTAGAGAGAAVVGAAVSGAGAAVVGGGGGAVVVVSGGRLVVVGGAVVVVGVVVVEVAVVETRAASTCTLLVPPPANATTATITARAPMTPASAIRSHRGDSRMRRPIPIGAACYGDLVAALGKQERDRVAFGETFADLDDPEVMGRAWP
ncbi:MAG TPA: hypothetical protein VEP49_12580 [Acidimicrobiia bacterium]|nr:hypothetical protein [Acidimicrobiia bacterium]